MTKLINNNELDIINKIARQSIYLSPYPNTFIVKMARGIRRNLNKNDKK